MTEPWKGSIHAFTREYLGKIVLGVGIALAIQAAAQGLVRSFSISADELRVAAAAALSQSSSGAASQFSDSELGLRPRLLPSETFNSPREAATRLSTPVTPSSRLDHQIACFGEEPDVDACRAVGRARAASQIGSLEYQRIVSDNLNGYRQIKILSAISIFLFISLQSWHLYHTFAIFVTTAPHIGETPRFAWHSTSAISLYLGIFVFCIVILSTLLGVIIIFSATSIDGGGFYWILLSWSALWFLYDVLFLGLLKWYNHGWHHRPHLYDVDRKSKAVNETAIWLIIDAIILSAVIFAGLLIRADAAPNSFLDYVQIRWVEITFGLILFAFSAVMIWFQWKQSRPRGKPRHAS